MPIVAEPAQRHGSSSGTTDQLRRNNLSKILGLLHRGGPFSRAELTRTTGLNRSTVGAVVTDLADLRLVYEGMPEKGAKAGRPSPMVHIDHRTVAIAVNPEVDAVHVGLVGLGGRVLEHVRVEAADTPSAEQVVKLATAAIADTLSGHDRALQVAGIGIAVPGQVRLSDGRIREATHMGWFEQPLAAMFERTTGHPAWAANAAMLAMRAESTFGAVRDVEDLVYIIGGASGIGGGVLTGGRLLTGTAGYAGEFGHTFVRSGGTACHCGAHGCFEAEVTQQRLLDSVGLHAAEADRLAAALAESTDPAVAALVAESLDLLGIVVRNAVNLFNPSVVVLSGFLAALHSAARDDGALVGEAIRSARENVRIQDAALGADQLMVGAAEIVFDELIADPAAFVAPHDSTLL
jgi:predicted NBD/HSP70 family sugar kinase